MRISQDDTISVQKSLVAVWQAHIAEWSEEAAAPALITPDVPPSQDGARDPSNGTPNAVQVLRSDTSGNPESSCWMLAARFANVVASLQLARNT